MIKFEYITQKKMDKKHLYWIVPLTLLIGIFIGMIIYSILTEYTNRLMLDVTFSCLEELYNISVV